MIAASKRSFERGEARWEMTFKAAGRFTKNRDLLGVAAESTNIGPHPFQCQLLILEPVIRECMTFRVERRVGEEAERPESTIERDHDQRPAGTSRWG